MKTKRIFAFLLACLISVSFWDYGATVDAATISDNGEYTVVFMTDTTNNISEINGEGVQAVKFDFADGEETVQLSEITKDIHPFGKYEFEGWKAITSSGYKIVTELPKSDFRTDTDIEVDGKQYHNAVMVTASYDSDKPIKNSGTYHIFLNGFGGMVNGKSTLRIEQKSSEFKTVDLTQYTAVRDGCIFVGWDYNGSIVESISESAFSEGDVITVQAVYKATDPSDIRETDYVLKLDANGGKIDGQDSKLYYYLGGQDSGTSMSLLPYIPIRDGYTFAGWNTEADGTGNNKKYIFWGDWGEWGVNTGVENALTLYANWTKNSDMPTMPDKPEQGAVKEIQSNGNTKGSIEFAAAVSGNFVLNIQSAEVKKAFADKNVKFIVDINVLENGQAVKISGTKMKIKIALPEELKGYNKYEAVYILNDEIKETMPAVIENGYIVFETTHLSQYGIVATNVDAGKTDSSAGKNVTNPKTGDNRSMMLCFAVLLVSGFGAFGTAIYGKKKKQAE